jgi:hypothetical protein
MSNIRYNNKLQKQLKQLQHHKNQMRILQNRIRAIECERVLQTFRKKAEDKLYVTRSRNGWFPVTRDMIIRVVNDVGPPLHCRPHLIRMLAEHAIEELRIEVSEIKTSTHYTHRLNRVVAERSIRNLQTWLQ